MSIYKEFNIVSDASPESGDVVSNAKDIVSSGMWGNGAATITAYYTSSTQSGSSGDHYLDVYSEHPVTTPTAKPQFSIAYAHFNGSGSLGKAGVAGNRASAAIYRQLSQTLLGPNISQFTFAGRLFTAGRRLYKGTAERILANALLNPESLKELIRLRKLPSKSKEKVAILSKLGGNLFIDEESDVLTPLRTDDLGN